MPSRRITTAHAPSSPLYAQGVAVGGLVLVSGMVGVDPSSGRLAGTDIGTQTSQALTNCLAVLEEAGSSREDIVEVGVLLARPEDFDGFNAEWKAWFPEDPPARYVAKLGVDLPGVLVSIRVTAGG